MKLVSGLKVSGEGTKFNIRWNASADDVWTAVEKAAKKWAEHKGQGARLPDVLLRHRRKMPDSRRRAQGQALFAARRGQILSNLAQFGEVEEPTRWGGSCTATRRI